MSTPPPRGHEEFLCFVQVSSAKRGKFLNLRGLAVKFLSGKELRGWGSLFRSGVRCRAGEPSPSYRHGTGDFSRRFELGEFPGGIDGDGRIRKLNQCLPVGTINCDYLKSLVVHIGLLGKFDASRGGGVFSAWSMFDNAGGGLPQLCLGRARHGRGLSSISLRFR